jgi:hypothetical protein
MPMAEAMTGGCACGKVRYTARVHDDEAYLCHCRMCQRATGSVSIAFKSVRKADVAWASGPDWYQSSPIALRPYCAACGTSLGFAHPDSDKMDLTVASFDAPGRFRPARHFGAESIHRAWLDTEGLPEMRADDYAPLVERWAKAGGRPA